MPTVRVPLVGSFNQRSIDADGTLTLAEDQRFKNCVFSVVNNPVTGKAAAYVEKRPGWVQDSIPAAGSPSTGMIVPQSFVANLSAYGNTNSVVYSGTTSVGTVTGRIVTFEETLRSGVSYVAMKSSDGTGWYYANGAKDLLTYTGHTSSGNATVSTVASVAGIYPGQLITGNTIGAGARVSTVNAGTSTITLTVNSTGTSTGAIITKEPIALIQDADFVTTGNPNGGFVDMDGYLFYTDGTNVRNSDLNTIVAYSATAFKATDMSPDNNVAIARSKNVVLVFGTGSVQGFQNAGYATGSPLERITQTFSRIGAQSQMAMSTLENDIFFLGSSNYGDTQAWRIRDYAPNKVSTPFVDKILGTVSATAGTNYVSAFQMGGYPYMLITMSTSQEGTPDKLLLESGEYILLESGDKIILEGDPASMASFARQLAYNAALNIWSEWDAQVATFVVGQGAGTNNNILATSRFGTSGKVYRINPASDGNVFTDDGSAYSLEIRTARIDHGTGEIKFIREVKLIADTQDAGTATLEASDDDYRTWKTLGSFDLTQTYKSVYRCGSHRNGRAYRITHSYNGPFRAEAVEITYDVGT